MRLALATTFLAVLLAIPAQAQEAEHYKDPTTATLFGVLIPGGGQLYAGDTDQGVILFGFGAGWPTAGALLTSRSGDYICEGSGLDQVCKTDYNYLPLVVGGAAGLASWIYGLVTASEAAQRHNRQHGITLAPAKERPGLALRVDID